LTHYFFIVLFHRSEEIYIHPIVNGGPSGIG